MYYYSLAEVRKNDRRYIIYNMFYNFRDSDVIETLALQTILNTYDAGLRAS
jgi:hypothetical protein